MKKLFTLTPTILLLLVSPAGAHPAVPTNQYAQPALASTDYAKPAQAASDYATPVGVASFAADPQATPFAPTPRVNTESQKLAERVTKQRAARRAYVLRVRRAAVGEEWAQILNLYTGGSYSTDHVNSLWQGAPRSTVVLAAAVHYHLPYRLLLGVWGAESGWGQAWNNFGLIGPATGELRHDAFYAARLFDKFYRQQYGRRAVR